MLSAKTCRKREIGATGNNGVGVVGVNWQVSIMPLKALEPEGGDSATIIKAYNYAKTMRDLWASSGGAKTRAQVVREMIEIGEYKEREYNAAFVMM